MSHAEHHAASADRVVTAHVVVVTTSRTERSDTSGATIARMWEAAGHEVIGKHLVPDDLAQIREVVSVLAAGSGDFILLTGGTGAAPSDVTPEAVVPLFSKQLDGFGEIFRHLSFVSIGASAMLSRATAGIVGSSAVFALPGSTAAVSLAMEELIIPEAKHLASLLGEPSVSDEPSIEDAPAFFTEDNSAWEEPAPEAEPEEGAVVPTGKLGKLGANRIALGMEPEPVKPMPAGEGVPASGWRRAIFEIGGEILREKREELPQPVESFSPLIDVLNQAGEQAVLKLPSGVKYSIWGFPDLQRPGSKVLALGWGQPLCELLALHRYPTLTGTCIEEGHGLMPGANEDVSQVSVLVTGREPPDASGTLFAVTGSEVFIRRGNKVFRFDGSKERDEGTPKQVLASLSLRWSNR